MDLKAIDGFVKTGPQHRNYFVFPYADGGGLPHGWKAGYSVWKPEALNSFRAVLQGKVEGSFATRGDALEAAYAEGVAAIDRALGVPA